MCGPGWAGPAQHGTDVIMMVDPVTPDPGRVPRVTGDMRAATGPADGTGGVLPAAGAGAGMAAHAAAPVGPDSAVWAQLTAAQEPVGHEQIATASGLPDGAVLRVPCALGRDGYVLRIPGRRSSPCPFPQTENTQLTAPSPPRCQKREPSQVSDVDGIAAALVAIAGAAKDIMAALPGPT